MNLERAIAIAVEAHRGQLDKGGAPYILHPLRVMLAVEADDERIVAVLHDVLEDCPEWTSQRLTAEGFSATHVEALEALARRPDETYGAFVERLKPNPLARRVKLADLADNSNLSRIDNPQPADFRRLERYAKATAVLTQT